MSNPQIEALHERNKVNERRITKETIERQDPRSRLKHIAGLIQQLPYKDMVELGRLLNQEYSSADPAGGLLRLSERILEGQPAPEFHDGRGPG